jgi:RNA polymerase sigma factor for flagellar operon FliA
VGAYSPLVKYVVNWSSSTRGSVYEDRLAWGMVGLLEAVESYDPARGAKFETYAISKIQYAILQGFRREDPCPRRLRFFARENERVSRELTQHLGRCPTEAEMVRKMGTSVKRYRTLTEQYSRTEIASPEAWPENEHSPNDLADIVTDQGAFDPQIQTERTELQELLIEAVGALKERERLVVSLYFYEDLKLKEIGRVLELSEARISQILNRALCKLRESLTEGAWLMLAS